MKQYSVGVYIRESRDENGENIETLEVQKELLLDFIKSKNLGSVYRIYEDDNVSGSGFDRIGINQLKDDVISGKINMIVIKDLSRLGRNNAKTLLFLDFLEEYGVRVLTFDGRYDSLRDSDTVGIDTWYNERYIKDISKKIRSNLKFKIQRGEYIGNAPYGYKKSEEKKNSLDVNQMEAQVVKEIFQLYLNGFGYQYIANYLNNKDIPGPGEKYSGIGSKGWNPVAVKRILTNRVYIGDTVQGVSEKISFKSKKTRRLPENCWVITQNTHTPIIGKDIFEQVQKLRSGKIGALNPHKGELHLFRGVLYCGRCGSPMFARKRSNRPMGYTCGNYAKHGKQACESHHVSEELLLNIVNKELQHILNNPDIIQKTLKILKKQMEDERGINIEIVRLKKQLQASLRQQDYLYLDKLEGKISDQLFSRTNMNLERKISQMQDEILKLQEIKEKEARPEELLRDFQKSLQERTLTNQMIRLLIDRIVVYSKGDRGKEDEIEVVFNFNDVT